ncbi:tetratricopeptide repeat protein 19, mitochondrial-like [Portunus trituberculatus]|uniref:Tetratricopeptide repeat protein 19, mitochondrial n=1 Tax=Portunus trituberculatus TaxID=210409 RepID=A0A5B7F235_PORTR|nr:tetratricopeptide repeat protein 19, mitochondrial-like [Portunus trituberculatus]MPC41440.1 Tetratricopeptide repeat protein 19, mitochondrial [Portunus trituberculatus]
MYFASPMPVYFHILRVASRGQLYLEHTLSQRLACTSRGVASSAVKEKHPISKNNFVIEHAFHEKENYSYDIGRNCLFKKSNLADHSWCLGPSNLKSHTSGSEHAGRGRHGWSLASVLALSIFSTRSEGEEEKKESELIIMIKRGILALKSGELKKAEQLLHVALKMAQETNNQQAVTYIFDLLANLAYQREEYPKAEQLFKDVLQRLLSGGMAEDDNAVVEISLKLASVYASVENYEKAVQGFQFCISTQEEKINKKGEAAVDEDTLLLWAMSMDWYARFLLNLHKFELAKQHFLKAYEMSARVNGWGHSQTAVLLNDIGSVCSLQKNYTEAMDYLEKAIAAAREAKSSDIGSFYVNLGTVYLQQGLHGEARRCCKEGLTLSRKMKNIDGAEEAEICLAEIEKVIKAEERK